MNGALNGHVIELNGTMLNGCFSITPCLITRGHGSSFQTMLLDLTATSLESWLVIRKSEVHIIYNIPFPILLGTPPISIKYMFFSSQATASDYDCTITVSMVQLTGCSMCTLCLRVVLG